MVTRRLDEAALRSALAEAPVVLLAGPRQAGKSTLVGAVVNADRSNRFDLEDPRDVARLGDPTLSLSALAGTVVIDEAQRRPDLFPVLRVLVDEDRRPGRFVVLGNASPDLIGLSSESLAGRVAIVGLGGFRLADVSDEPELAEGRATPTDRLWIQGGLPRSFLASTPQSMRWRLDYIATFLERDLANLGFRIPPTAMRRFWTMLAHYHGQTWNGAELARALSVSEPTVRRYLDALTDALLVRQLQPWFTNVGKRQVHSPKVYIRDSGLLHALLGLRQRDDVLGHPKAGASWEGFVLEQLITAHEIRSPSFWGTHAGAELDLRVDVGGRAVGIEIKRTDRPKVTSSMRSAIESLQLSHGYVIHAGSMSFPLSQQVTALSLEDALVPDVFTAHPR